MLIHLAAFYVFQVIYPTAPLLRQEPPPVIIVNPSDERFHDFLAWVEANDPARRQRIPEIIPPASLDAVYVPSYARLTAQPRLPENRSPSVNQTTIHPPLAWINSGKTPAASPVAPTFKTSLHFSSKLAARIPAESLPKLDTIQTATPLNRTVFLLGINETGTVQFAFLRQSCGNSTADQSAESALLKTNFSEASKFAWEFATINWAQKP